MGGGVGGGRGSGREKCYAELSQGVKEYFYFRGGREGEGGGEGEG